MLLRFIDVTASNSGERLDNVNRTHLALASDKRVLPKKLKEMLAGGDLQTRVLRTGPT